MGFMDTLTWGSPLKSKPFKLGDDDNERTSLAKSRYTGKHLMNLLDTKGLDLLRKSFKRVGDFPGYKTYLPTTSFPDMLAEFYGPGTREFRAGKSTYTPVDYSKITSDVLANNPALKAFKANLRAGMGEQSEQLADEMARRGVLSSGGTKGFYADIGEKANRALASETGRLVNWLVSLQQQEASREQQAKEGYLGRAFGGARSDLTRRDLALGEWTNEEMKNYLAKTGAMQTPLNMLMAAISGGQSSFNLAETLKTLEEDKSRARTGGMAGIASNVLGEYGKGGDNNMAGKILQALPMLMALA